MKKSGVTYENPAFDKDSFDVGDGVDIKTVVVTEVEEVEASTTISVKDVVDEPDTPKISNFSKTELMRELRSIRINLAIVTISSVLVSAPMMGLMASTTSLLDDEGLGITSLAVSSVAQFVGFALLLNYVSMVFGVRKIISVTMILPIAFIVSFAYPSWYTTLPASIFLGIGMAFLTSIIMYGNALGYYYARLTNGNSDTILVVIIGFLASSWGAGTLIGNGVIFSVFNIGLDDENSTEYLDLSNFEVCGANYCNEMLVNMTTMRKPETFRYYALVGGFAGMAILGGVLSLFLRDFSTELGFVTRKKTEYFSIMKETLGLLKHPRGFLLIILTLFVGLEQAFIGSVYTHAYVSCIIGITNVGLIMMAFGGTQIIVCISQGYIIHLLGRFVVLVCGVCMVIGCCVTVLLLHPDPNQIAVFFALAIAWSGSDALISPAVFALYGILFESNIEGSLSLAAFWWGLGFMAAFIWSQFLCVSLKLYITIAVGGLGLLCYIILEISLRRNQRSVLKVT